MNDNFKIIEALLYVQGDKGITPKDVKEVLDMPTLNARKQLNAFKKEYNNSNRGLQIFEFNDVYKMATRSEFKEYISKLVTIIKKKRLSSSAIETAGIIAYKQPITKSQINEVRGISSEATVNTLLVKGLIEEKGIAKTPGSPILYGITDKFYDYFKIRSLKELPKLSEFNEVEGADDDFELFSSQRQD
ncbi:MAG: segregation/condensation protein B [Mycoplasmatales bacterium]|nr:segregation/condensation protein B [Mycoplasmatales bacterium]